MTPQVLLGSVLSLAVQGKIVSQLPSEGTAETLYKYLIDEKQRLIKVGGTKKSKTLSPIVDNEKLFEIPDSWRWIKMGEIASVITKGTTPRGGNVSYLDSGIGFLRAENVAGLDKLDKSSMKYIDEDTHLGYLKRSVLKANDILITIAGTLGRTAIVRKKDLPLNANQAVSMIRLVDADAVNLTYIVYALNSLEIQRYLTKQKKVTAIPNLTLEIIENCLLPLPPLAEQKRIVAKVEELLPIIDRYEQAWSRLEDFNKRFPVDMQKSILQMAIQGKLVEQRPEEGTGEELYQLIQAEKRALIKAGKIKKEKPLPEITEDELLLDIPESWKWVRLGTVIDMLSGFAFKSADFKESGRYRLLRGINLSVGSTRWDDTVYVDNMPGKLNVYQIHKGDVLIGLDRPWISDGIRVAIFDEDEDTYLVQRVLRVRETTAITKEYIALLLRSNLFRNSIESETTGISVPHISPGQVGGVAVPLPPLAEQKRIVAKLEEILPLCEQLK